MNNIGFDTLIMITPKDYSRLRRNYPRIAMNIPYGRLIFVGSREVGSLVAADGFDERIDAIDEDEILKFSDVHACVGKRMENILAGRELPRGVTGWYYQQFLKMQYASICRDEYYLVWDGDTIPCKRLFMFKEGTETPYLDLKHEFHEEYFETIGRILPGCRKVIERSFISEHMLIKCSIMKALIADIEKNENIPGTYFWEKIINSIPEDKIQSSSFSEFETYGTYTAINFPSDYKLREWHSFRLGGEFFDPDTISDRDFEWLSHDFDAISFEKDQSVREDHRNLFDNPVYQEKLTAKQMLQAAQLEFTEGYKEVWGEDSAGANVNTGAFSDVGKDDNLKYLSEDTYRLYDELGDRLKDKNIDQAYLCYENAAFLCHNDGERSRILEKSSALRGTGKVNVRKTALIILSHNNAYLMQKCLESIRLNCDPSSCEVVILDNASDDGIADWLKLQENITLLLSDKNEGFTKGCNIAIEYADRESDIFLLNNDTRVPPNALFWLRMGLYEAEDVGAVGSMVNYCNNKQLRDVAFAMPEDYVEYGAKNNIFLEEPYIEEDALGGFAMLIKRKVLDEVGVFDESFSPGYFEDTDLSFRIRKAGYRLNVVRNSFIYHVGSQSFAKRPDLEEIYERNKMYFMKKWEG
ncbi:MAG: glycosyltransferase family 2 protein [Lachnospiraceae bacterium]|nr:glycosyltransferase family 2 protein [Lachnospiraceae bacterium]